MGEREREKIYLFKHSNFNFLKISFHFQFNKKTEKKQKKKLQKNHFLVEPAPNDETLKKGPAKRQTMTEKVVCGSAKIRENLFEQCLLFSLK